MATVKQQDMQDLLRKLLGDPTFRRVSVELDAGRSVSAEGLWGGSMAFLAAALAVEQDRLFLTITAHVEEAEAFAEDISLFANKAPSFFPAWETLDPEEQPDVEILSRRLTLLKQLFFGEGATEPTAGNRNLIVAPVGAILQRVPAPETLARNTLTITRGTEMGPDHVAEWLVDRGFEPAYQVEVPGEFSRRGGILDIFPLGEDAPIRIEYFGDRVESIRRFDVTTQASQEDVGVCRVTAVSKAIAPRERDSLTSFLSHLPENTVIVLKEPVEVMTRAQELAGELSESGIPAGDASELAAACNKHTTLNLTRLPAAVGVEAVPFDVRATDSFHHDIAAAIQDLRDITEHCPTTIVLCNNEAEAKRFRDLLRNEGLAGKKAPETRIGRLTEGFELPSLGLALVPHHQIFHRYRQRREKPRYRHVSPVEALVDLKPGDYVVHATHGIGRYEGLELLDHEGGKREYLTILYKNRTKLFVPADKIELVQKYIAPTEHHPSLSKLGGEGWKKRKERARRAVQDLAAELLRLQAIREAMPGIAFPADSELEREFETAFPYEETEDQIVVADEIDKDMTSSRPMDRLVCGDVGYGKTELAMRAAFKATLGQKQTAVLVPTTILAAQHYRTFSERMADYPVFVEMLSRFRTRAEQKRIIERLADGSVDIIIGTHRLLQPDVRFKDLGLVIIDEEQRFGVEHKEHLKQMRETVEVLTLTATPIPRTLHMALVGIRDVSSLTTPPRDRLAIQTRLWRFDIGKVRRAILQELARDGQVFLVHNRVETIDDMAQKVKEAVPEANILVGHGQMPERLLERTMKRFVNGDADVLVCTTIIESGLDIPRANTIIINNADQFGLADLHQLRGRVGRYRHRAYAYLLLPERRPINPTAEKRLKAIQEFAELGAGFKIAMRDLEIRGAGDILGPEQHGHITAVGYDMYYRFLEVAVRRLRGEQVIAQPEVTIALGTASYIPEEYIPDAQQRIEFYRRIAKAPTLQDLDGLESNLRDRFGPVPEPAKQLAKEAKLRLLAGRVGVSAISLVDGVVVMKSRDSNRTLKAFSRMRERCRLVAEDEIHLRIRRGLSPDEIVARLTEELERE